ncbi:MAG: ABC transporter ATP-binding protein [Chloroflexi bacterium]|nr:ABC transporter ATP-binding protein [Chloroflexota bacterium]
MSTTTWPTWRYFARLISFRPWLWWPNLLSIVLLIGLETVPALVSRAFFDWLNAGMGELQPFVWMLVLLTLSTLGRVTFLFGCQFTNAPFMYTGTALLQHNMFRRLLQLPAGVALQHTSGEALSRFRDDTEETGVFLIPFNDVIAWSLFAIVGLVILLSVSVTLTLGVFVPLVVLGFVLHALRVRIEAYRRAARVATADVTSHLGDTFGAAQIIQLANAERDVVERFRSLNQIRLATAIRDRLLDQLLQSVSRNTSNIGTGVILLLGSRSMATGSFSVGDFALFVFYLGWIGEFTALFGSMLAKYRQAGVSFGRMVELMHGSAPPSLVEHRPIFHPPAAADVWCAAHAFEVLEVVDLTYVHPDSGRGVRHITFQVRRGERVMVTGRVASGKTTLLRGLLGVLPRQSGSVLWNRQPVKDAAEFFVPPRCAYTPQLPRLFSDSLRRNLLLGLDCSDQDLKRAVAESQFGADLSALQAGLESEVGARGVALSGGQLQRAALARMLVRPAELLVLDDLSSLDGPTEEAVWSALVADGSRTILAATHRRAALRRADRVLVLCDGELVDQGPLDDVLVRCEEMRALWAALR